MEFSEVIHTLRAHRLALGVVVVLSLIAAVLAGHRIVLGMPPHLRPRSLETGIASKQLVLDSPESSMATLHSDTEALIERSGAFAQVLGSQLLLQDIAHVMHVPVDDITAEGPYDGAASIYDVVTPSEARSNQVIAEHRRYRLTFYTQIGLPIVTVSAQGPTPAEAARLADSSYPALQTYLRQLKASAGVAPHFRFVVREVGPATAGSVGGGAVKASPVLAMTIVLLLGSLAIVTLSGLRRRLTPRREALVPFSSRPAS